MNSYRLRVVWASAQPADIIEIQAPDLESACAQLRRALPFEWVSISPVCMVRRPQRASE